MSAGGMMQMALLGVLFLTILPLAANPNEGRPMAGMPCPSAAALSASSLSFRRRITTADAAAITEGQRRSLAHKQLGHPALIFTEQQRSSCSGH